MAQEACSAGHGPRAAATAPEAVAVVSVQGPGESSKEAWKEKEQEAETKSEAARGGKDDGTKVQWQWEHRTGFKPYSKEESDRIESYFQQGAWMMRMKSGTGKKAAPREIFFMDMVQYDPSSDNERKIRRVPEPTQYVIMRRWLLSMATSFMDGDEFWWKPKSRQFFEDRRDLDEFNKEDFVAEIYETESRAFRIVESALFSTVAYLAIIANTIYIWADADYNNGTTYGDTEPVFIVFDNLFTVWFLIEAIIRWCALKTWKSAFRDSWFMLDVLLVGLMIIETWLINVVLYFLIGGENAQGLNKISILRVLRLLRLARIARLFKVFPQLIVLMKGMFLAMKSLIYTVMLLFVLTGIGAIVFKNFADTNQGLKDLKYDSVGGAFWNLLVYGTFVDALSDHLFALKDLHLGYALLLVVYIFMSNLTMLNMLIGVLCEVIARVTDSEKEATDTSELERDITEILECYDVEDDHLLKLSEFDALMKNPDLKVILANHDIDHGDLLKLQDVFFQERLNKDGTKKLKKDGTPMEPQIKFPHFLDKVLQLRGGNTATVGDVVELRSFLQMKFGVMEATIKKLEDANEAREDADARSEAKVSAATQAAQSPKDAFEEAVMAQLKEIRSHQDALQLDMRTLQMQLQELQAPPAASADV